MIDVHDGDTLTAISNKKNQTYKVRLANIDTPETDFQQKSQGSVAGQARAFLQSLIPANGTITINNELDTDRHGRILGVISVNGKELNLEMLKNGWAVPYTIDGTNQDKLLEYAEACLDAEQTKLGIFAEQNAHEFEEPYQFRMRFQKKLGRNLIGNILTKKLYTALEIDEVPVCLRVFYSNELLAKSQGFSQ